MQNSEIAFKTQIGLFNSHSETPKIANIIMSVSVIKKVKFIISLLLKILCGYSLIQQ